jgi:hypothetical protein
MTNHNIKSLSCDPLSSLASIPCTSETRQALVDAGLDFVQPLTELAAQSFLALRNENDDGDHPSCFRRQFDPASALCGGCLSNPHCWTGDTAYLTQLSAKKKAAPFGVPAEAVEARLTSFKRTTRKRRRPPPSKK